MKTTILLLALFCSIHAPGQHNLRFAVLDEASGEPLPDVSIVVKGSGRGSVTDVDGKAVLKNMPAGKYPVHFTLTGFNEKILELNFPLTPDSIITVQLSPEDKEIENITILSSRTDSRIENTPSRVEVIGLEEVEEESGVKPANISWLLGDVAGIQAQQTSSVTGNTELRIQGLRGEYTQMLRDGVPLFGGYAGGFSVLEMPPQDIRQIEIIKGSTSTLYGGGAIAGMINIITKKPVLGKKERSLLINQSTLKESDLNIYLSERRGNIGYTFFGGGTFQKQVDVNDDGFSDVGRLEGAFIHPTFYFYPNEKNTISLGLNSSLQERQGGDMIVLAGFPNNVHRFYIRSQAYRNTGNFVWESKLNSSSKFTVKATTSAYRRNISTNVFGMKAKQLSWFSEASYVKKLSRHDIVAGINVNGDQFRKGLPDSTQISDYSHVTAGAFIQHGWKLHPKFIIETGLRGDYHNEYGTFILPRISLLFKPTASINSRLGGGLGYKIPSAFESEIDERDYKKIQALKNLKAERSYGANWDVNFSKEFGEVEFVINQSLFLTHISKPIILNANAGMFTYSNTTEPLVTKGMETWIKIGYAELEVYLGYTLTEAIKQHDPIQPYLELSARDKFAGMIMYEFSEKVRTCIEATYTGRQYLDDGRITPSFPILAGMVQYNPGRFSFVLNCENWFDYRQTKKESIVIPPVINPGFKQVWAPLDGRIVNLSVKLRL